MKIDALDNIYILGLKFFCSSLSLEDLFFFFLEMDLKI